MWGRSRLVSRASADHILCRRSDPKAILPLARGPRSAKHGIMGEPFHFVTPASSWDPASMQTAHESVTPAQAGVTMLANGESDPHIDARI